MRFCKHCKLPLKQYPEGWAAMNLPYQPGIFCRFVESAAHEPERMHFTLGDTVKTRNHAPVPKEFRGHVFVIRGIDEEWKANLRKIDEHAEWIQTKEGEISVTCSRSKWADVTNFLRYGVHLRLFHRYNVTVKLDPIPVIYQDEFERSLRLLVRAIDPEALVRFWSDRAPTIDCVNLKDVQILVDTLKGYGPIEVRPFAPTKPKKVTIRIDPDGEISIRAFGRQSCKFLPGRINAAISFANYLYRHPEVMPPL